MDKEAINAAHEWWAREHRPKPTLNWACIQAFGICSAPEHFQKRTSRILQGLPSVLCQVDDVIVYGKNKEEHDMRL